MSFLEAVLKALRNLLRTNDRIEGLTASVGTQQGKLAELTERVTRLEVQVDLLIRLLMRRLE